MRRKRRMSSFSRCRRMFRKGWPLFSKASVIISTRGITRWSTEILIQGQQFGSFERLVRVTLASYDRSEMFLWGLCDQLKQLAETHSDISIRQNALKFLGELYQNDPLADQHVSVRQKIEQVLQDFARNPNAQVRRTA